MKTNSHSLTSLRRCVGGLAGAVALLLSVNQASAAVTDDPSNGSSLTWDCLMSGRREEGIAFLTFFNDGSFGVVEILTSKTSGDTSSGRPGTGGSRGGGTETNSVSTVTNEFGFGGSSGSWTVDSQGRIVGGYFRDTPDGPQGVSFLGKASGLTTTHPRLKLTASTAQGTVNYKGVLQEPLSAPTAVTAPDVSGDWIGFKTENNQKLFEQFTLSPAPLLNGYFMSGTGPGYSYDNGLCLVSVQKKIAFGVAEVPVNSTNQANRVSYGNLKVGKSVTSAATRGIKAADPKDVRINFNAEFVAPAPVP